MLRIGLLGASRISRGAVLKPAGEIAGAEVVCVAARDPARAAEFASEHGIAEVAASYDDLIRDDSIDLVYNGLPPREHARWSIAALEAGRHVLCEKPFAMNADEARTMVAAAGSTGNQLIEAFHHRFHPAFERTLQLLHSGAIGAIQSVDAHFNVPIAFNPGEIRYNPSLGGGAMMDLGCYPVHWSRSVMQAEPTVATASAIAHESGVDISMQAELEFAGGVKANVSCSMAENLPDELDVELRVAGEAGTLTMTNPLVPHIGNEILVETDAGVTRAEHTGESTYFHQLQHVIGVLEGRIEPTTGGADAIANMQVLDDCYRLSGLR